MRFCKHCQQDKPEEAYSQPGFYFRECYATAAKAWRSKNKRQKITQPVTSLVCYRCKEEKAC